MHKSRSQERLTIVTRRLSSENEFTTQILARNIGIWFSTFPAACSHGAGDCSKTPCNDCRLCVDVILLGLWESSFIFWNNRLWSLLRTVGRCVMHSNAAACSVSKSKFGLPLHYSHSRIAQCGCNRFAPTWIFEMPWLAFSCLTGISISIFVLSRIRWFSARYHAGKLK